jgi:hypothetical protein
MAATGPTPLTPREFSPNSLETATYLDTKVLPLTAEDTMDAEQGGDQSEGMTMDADGPFHCNEDTREIPATKLRLEQN